MPTALQPFDMEANSFAGATPPGRDPLGPFEACLAECCPVPLPGRGAERACYGCASRWGNLEPEPLTSCERCRERGLDLQVGPSRRLGDAVLCEGCAQVVELQAENRRKR